MNTPTRPASLRLTLAFAFSFFCFVVCANFAAAQVKLNPHPQEFKPFEDALASLPPLGFEVSSTAYTIPTADAANFFKHNKISGPLPLLRLARMATIKHNDPDPQSHRMLVVLEWFYQNEEDAALMLQLLQKWTAEDPDGKATEVPILYFKAGHNIYFLRAASPSYQADLIEAKAALKKVLGVDSSST